MAEYRRFVAYIYEYINGRKSRNAGFAKVESRNGICRIQIHIQDMMPGEGKIEIFGFVRENGVLPAVLLGEGQAQNAVLERRITTPEETVAGSGYSFDRIGGIWIRSEGGRNWATVFDDEPLEIEKLGKTAADMGKKAQAAVKAEEPAVKAEEPAVKAEEPAVKAEEPAVKAEEPAVKAEEPAVKAEEPAVKAEESVKKEEAAKKEERAEVRQADSEKEAEGKETAADAGKEAEAQEKAAGLEQKAAVSEIMGTKSEEMAAKTEKPSERKNAGCAPHTDKRWNCVTARYPHFQPVSDDSMEDAIRIQPSDLRTLWQKGWKQGSNSFLMHGFYQYRYLMLGKCRDGRYVLGVPGIYDEQEQYMAKMFGFSEFKPAGGLQEGRRFGYWCRFLD